MTMLRILPAPMRRHYRQIVLFIKPTKASPEPLRILFAEDQMALPFDRDTTSDT